MEQKRRILVVDASRVVRATLTKHLKDDFEVLEEANGESAWQMLMLDASIVAVISGFHPLKLEGEDLVARMRASAMRRLRALPFFLIVSDIDGLSGCPCGVTDLISKSMDRPTMLAHLARWLEPEQACVCEPASVPAASAGGDFDAVVAALDPGAEACPVCIVVFGIDDLGELTARFGDDLADRLLARLGLLLEDKLAPGDRLGYCSADRLGIVSHGVDMTHGTAFARRVCARLAAGQIGIRGEKIRLTVSAGVASTCGDPVDDGLALFALAGERLRVAQMRGGNSVVAGLLPDPAAHGVATDLSGLLDELGPEDDPAANERLGRLGLQVLPLLQRINERLDLGLSMAEVERRLAQLAQRESISS